MKEIYFKVSLKSNVVLNNKLATEGNMETLDYIPGSNFLGIVATQLYNKLSPQESYDIFHSGKVSFGDARISENNELSYPVPFNFMMVKGEDKLGEDEDVFLQHLLTKENHPKENGYKLQLKQQRSGFITPSGKSITKINKTFALKSAQNSSTRRSRDGAMFGFESLQKGQEFIFSVQFKDDKYVEAVTNALIGNKRIGKSRSAQYGQVHIEKLDQIDTINRFEGTGYSLVYVQSNLCVIDKITGQPTHQPTAKDMGLNGEINWSKSYVRTYSYSPWNGKRNTNDALRTCIAAGSVLYVNGENDLGESAIGAYQAEGLGRIIINPKFLQGNESDAKSDFVKIDLKPKKEIQSGVDIDYNEIDVTTSLGKFLKQKGIQQQNEIELSKEIQKQYLNATTKEGTGRYQRVTSSQWGAIRAYATKAKSFDELRKELFEGKEAYLKHGVAYDRIWSRGQNLKNLEAVFKIAEESSNPMVFVAKFAAQMAKYEQKQ